jgi:hypothetical protein
VSGIFISYRRDDSAGWAGRLYDYLGGAFAPATLFMDVDTIPRGETFGQTLKERLQQADVLLAVIGPKWLTVADDSGRRRIDNPEDWVRTEIAFALKNAHLTIPVLVGGAKLPARHELPAELHELLDRQFAEVRDSSWKLDAVRLSNDIKRRRRRGTWPERLRKQWVSILLITAVILILGGAYAYERHLNSLTRVPLLTDFTLDRATSALTDAGLKVGTVEYRERFLPENAVFLQTPKAGLDVRRGTSINLYVATPMAIDLTGYIRIRNTGKEGTVIAAALATAMDASLAAQGQRIRVSMRYAHEKCRMVDAQKAPSLVSCFYVARRTGVAPDEMWPYKAFDNTLPPGTNWTKLDAAAASYRADASRVDGLKGILNALHSRRPVIAVARATDSWYSSTGNRTGVIKLQGERESLRGLTNITIVGYNPKTGQVKFANNWGTTWGDKGFGYLEASDVDRILEVGAGFWAVQALVTPQKEGATR